MYLSASPNGRPMRVDAPTERGYAKKRPSEASSTDPKSCVARTNVVYAVRTIVAPICSTMAPNILLKISSSTRSVCMDTPLEVQHAPFVHFEVPARRDNDGGVVLLDDARTLSREAGEELYAG